MPLRLKSLELHGYKTFAARTFFEFAPGITAVVGPNGAGKSNIADALRWVLGEQTYSLLRGKKTEDMIFSGSEHRPRAGIASAEVAFDNSSKWLPVDFSEVAMTRRAYRDGHNDYLLNGQHVRLRDMNELLAASGLSERTYTMVGQGLVDASLALRADERRRLFEEAAGIGLYRVRREESLRRLENTLRNLQRVQDIMAEIEPRLKTLARQAKRAKEYASAQADLKEVLREWYGHHWHRAQQDLQKVRDSVRDHQDKTKQARERLATAQSGHAQTRTRLAELRDQITSLNHEVSILHQERESASLARAVLEERRNAAASAMAAMSEELHALAAEDTLASERIRELEQEIQRLEGEERDAASELAKAESAHQALQAKRGALQTSLLETNEQIVGFGARRAETQARVDALIAQGEHVASRQEAGRNSLASILAELSDAEQTLDRLRSARSTLERRHGKASTSMDDARRVQEDAQAALQTVEAERAALSASHSRIKAQLEVLEQAQQMLTGFTDGARFLLDPDRGSQLRARGALSSLLTVPEEFEAAIASALGDALDSVLLKAEAIDDALNLMEREGAGRAVLLPLDLRSAGPMTAANVPDVIGVASELVEFPPELRGAVDALLGHCLLVRSRRTARSLQSRIPLHARVVTLQGEVFRGDGVIAAGKAPSSSNLSRRREKGELAAALKETTASLEDCNSRHERAVADLERSKQRIAEHEEELRALGQQLLKAQAAERRAELELERQNRIQDWHKSRLEELSAEASAAETERKQLTELLQELASSTDAAHERASSLDEALGHQKLDEAQELVAYWTTRSAVIRQSLDSGRLRKNEHDVARAKLQQRIDEIQARSQRDGSLLEELDRERTALVTREEELHEKMQGLEGRLSPAENELESLQQKEGVFEAAEAQAQKVSSGADRALSLQEIELVRRQEALESLRSRIVDDFGLVSFEYASTVEGPVPLPFEGLVEELRAVPELAPGVEDELNRRRSRLRRLGLINPEAARDYEAESQRYSFLSAQVQDLRQAEADLRQVIDELDELTRQEFSKTFSAVEQEFRSIFTRLFGGGSAKLGLTDPDNLIETGIEIEARLPGRREQGLSLLSGGERSLTAIALVFALLKVAPTPVCVLDEVDAMLDEANVGRFRDLLGELSQDTQFVVITHNRSTVQVADYIYGITMGRDSTSQVVSLRLDQVSEEMLGAQTR